MKYLLIALLLISCRDLQQELCGGVDSQCYEQSPSTSSVVPTDSTTTTSADAKAATYLALSYDASSDMRDSYGFIQPKQGTTYLDQGDAMMWNSVSLATMCMLGHSQMNTLWTAMKTHMFVDGRPRRHPLKDSSGTSISKDMVTGLLYVGAMAKYQSCNLDGYLTVLEDMVTYGKANDWEFQNPANLGDKKESTTLMTDSIKRMMVSVLRSYGSSTSISLDRPDIDVLPASMKSSDYILEKKFYCRQGIVGACIKGANMGAFGAHLFFLQVVTHYMEYKITGSSTYYSKDDLDTMLYDAGRLGDSIDQNNWLTVAAYRHFTGGTHNDISTFLNAFPDVLPGEIEGTNATSRGCTDFMWQRVGWEHCGGSGEVYTGNDFLQAYAWGKI